MDKIPPSDRNIFSDLIKGRDTSPLGLMRRTNSRRCGPAARNSSNVMHATRREQRRVECLVSRHCFQFRDNNRRERASRASQGYFNVVTSWKPSEDANAKFLLSGEFRGSSKLVPNNSIESRPRNFRIPRDSRRYSVRRVTSWRCTNFFRGKKWKGGKLVCRVYEFFRIFLEFCRVEF